MPESLIHMGTLTRPHGIKGEICMDWHADSLLLLDKPLFLRKGEAAPQPMRMRSRRMHQGRPLLLLEGIADRTAAEALRGAEVLVRRADLPAPEAGEAYLADMFGWDVLLADGSRLGRLAHFEYPAGQELWAVLTDDGREVLFPARAEFITAIDSAARNVRIDPPEGLLDIYLS